MVFVLSRSNAAPDAPRPAAPAHAADALLLDDLQRRAFRFFWDESHPKTGLTRDRARNVPGPDTHKIASVAATGYALAALPIGVERGWVSRDAAYRRAVVTLRFVQDRLPQIHGFYWHFVDGEMGERAWNCELSSIDSGLLALGALTAGRYWPGTEAARLADGIYARMDWRWMQRGGATDAGVRSLAMGWTPEKGWIKARWEGYSEAAFLYLLAMGSPRHSLGRDAWDRWRIRVKPVEGYPLFGGASPLFWAQMTPGFFDLRGLRDRQGRDWWRNYGDAHRADRAYCERNGTRFATYAAGYWGITACDQPPPVGYGAQWPADGHNDGTVAPTAMGAAILFTPEAAKRALNALSAREGDRLRGRYGFSNAFNIDRDWYDTDVIGIDLGMMLLAIENHRSGLTWRLLRRHPAVVRGMAAAGFAPAAGSKARHAPAGRLPVAVGHDAVEEARIVVEDQRQEVAVAGPEVQRAR